MPDDPSKPCLKLLPGEKDALNIYTGEDNPYLIRAKGKYVADLSQHPEEREVLLPPTKLQWIYHQEFDVEGVKKHVFIAKPVTPLNEDVT